jgi:DNA polymerase-3 subunit gamma/tau
VRDVIINTIAINPARDRYKIFIIDEVHMLSMSAFNALLKTLEEPPPHVVFILATTELHKLPQTILSRCQHFEFRTIAAESIAARLRLIAEAEQLNVSDAALMQVALAGQGSMRDAQSAFDQVISFAGSTIKDEDVRDALGIINQQTLVDFTLAIAERNESRLIQLVGALAATGYDLRQFCRDLMTHFRHLLVLKTIGFDREALPIVESELENYRAQAKNFSSQDLVRFFHLLTTLEQEIKLTTQPRFQLEIGLIKLAQLTRLQSLDEILQRLTALEARLTGGSTPASAPAPAPKRASESAPKRASENEPRAIVAPPRAKPNEPANPIKSSSANASNANDGEIIKPAPPAAKKIAAATPPEPPPEPPYEAPEEPPWVEPPPATSSTTSPTTSSASRPASATPSNSGDAIERSGDAIERLKNELEQRKKMMLLTAIESAQIELAGDILRLSFDGKASEFYKKVATKESKQIIKEAARGALGLDLKIDVRLNDGAAMIEDDSAAMERQNMRKQAENSQAVQMFVKKFKGELTEVQREDEKSNS